MNINDFNYDLPEKFIAQKPLNNRSESKLLVMNKNNKVDFSPLEDTMNSFLVALEEKISSQQDKINSLEEKLTNVMDLLDEKDTAQLTKKVGGMDRQIAKLNKSIEKIASHVVEK